ncbi:Transient receptor potential cation channel protein painless [Habropoda laboriosa]|uniref:Transient receptor potential cation channel protein painless n=1 Tax=Habropoda laboriosa TaxID=597456 RepID=A0A0L7R634_9HYME|nr:PREDICTED: transient receptor potential cation channel protein painless-like [Habropoda laboriosa]XP_017789117.1 PREDICTED: transient receptor potential cation channel protein painless-like [Habropoda laboriosa]KOC66313.1 Transient receptor potential cation channel protein painless [Habropoda laboriosa]
MDPEDESLDMHLLHDYTPNPRFQDIYKQLWDHLCARNYESFRNIFERYLKKQPLRINVNYSYSDRSEETLLDIACKNGFSEFVQFLLEKGAIVNRVNQAHNRGPIHFATEKGHVNVLRVLLEEPTINPNLEAGQQTALHMAVKKNYLDCAELLLQKSASPNIPNNKGLTALHMAAMQSEKDMINLIMEKTKHKVDLDSYKDYNNQTTREVLQEQLPDIQLPPVDSREGNDHNLKYYLNANDEMNFLKCLKTVKDDVVNNIAEDLIEMAVERRFRDAVIELLDRTKKSVRNLEKAANLAIQQGLPHILCEILNTDLEVKNDLLLNACIELDMLEKASTGTIDKRLECLNLILEREDVDVRCTDSKGNTPLHYAARADCREAVTSLLKKGSYIGHMNNFGVPPVADISMSTLSQYFDDCIQAKRGQSKEYYIEFDYKCLMPHDTSDMDSQQNKWMNQEKREMDALRYISSKSNLKYLLKHPLLSSFLYLKWLRVKPILCLNLIFYILFYILLNCHIVYRSYVKNPYAPTNSSTEINESSSVNTLQILTGIMLVIFTLKEILQLISSPYHYISTYENWMEIALIGSGFAVLNGAGTPITVVTILLSAWVFIILLGKYPRFSTAVEMFKTVSLNFMRFLAPYVILIYAFALAFFILFKDGSESFPDFEHSLFKTIIMLTGEFDADDIPFMLHPLLSHLVFVAFVFLIAIILFNLLNGLAVSDTADILGKAELVGLISRVQVLAYMENVAVGTSFAHNKLHCLVCCGFLRVCGCNPSSFFAEKMLLFPSFLKSGKLKKQPHNMMGARDNEMYYKGRFDENTTVGYKDPFKMLIFQQAKEILSKRSRKLNIEKVISELKEVKEKLSVIEFRRYKTED